ncbi:MAG: SpoIIE family protein phosphatase [Ignavibacteria bacterium]|nr:SpoIIE family protein phosphatase [Ignavibacteria bacterium]
MISTNNNSPKEATQISFWNRKIFLFRSLIILLSIALTIVIAINTYRNATTVFSGTHYMSLPSKYYIQKTLYLQKLVNNLPYEKDTIPVGSFLLGINEKILDSNITLDSIKNIINNQSLNSIIVFNLKKVTHIKDLDKRNRFFLLADTFIVDKNQITGEFIKELNEGVFIGYLEKGEPTDLAGIQAGDVLLNIKGTPLNIINTQGAEVLDEASLKFLRGQEPDVPIPYNILRNNQIISIDVKLATIGFPTQIVFILLEGFLFFICGIIFALIKPQLIAARLTGIAFILIGFFLPATISNYPIAYDTFTYLKVYMYNVAFFIFVPILLHSFIYFPSPNTKLIEKKNLILILYILFSLIILPFSILYFYNAELTKQPYFILIFILGLIYFIILKIIFRKHQANEYRTLSHKFYALWILGFIAILMNPISFILDSTLLKKISEYSHLILIAIPLVYFYSIAKYKLLGIDFKIRRGAQYLIISIIWKISLIVFFIIFLIILSDININFPDIKISIKNIQVFFLSKFDEYDVIYNKIFFTLTIFIIIFLGWKFNKLFQKHLDKKYYRGSYDYMSAQTELTRQLMKTFSVQNFANTFIRKITELARLKQAGIILFSPTTEYWSDKIFCFNQTKLEKFLIEVSSNLSSSLKNIREKISISYLKEDLMNFLKKYDFNFVLPIIGKDKIYGILFIGEKLSETTLNSSDIDFINALATSASVGIENSLLYEELAKQERLKQELEIAHKIQIASLPQSVPKIKNLEIFAKSIPALEVGGDFYDFLNGKDNKFTIVVGDVSGKGTYAALYMSKVQGIFQTLYEFYDTPGKLLTNANKFLYKHIDSKSFITAICASYDTERNMLNLARAGHIPMFYYNKEVNEVRKVQPEGLGLGISDNKTFEFSLEQISINYKPGDMFIFVTDGITEAMNNYYEQYGESNLIEIIKDFCTKPAEVISEEIIKSVKKFSGDVKQHDDITIVVVKAI